MKYIAIILLITGFVLLFRSLKTDAILGEDFSPFPFEESYHWNQYARVNKSLCGSHPDVVAAFRDSDGKFDHCFYW